MSTSEARILANRKNCLKSTGPKTAEGKERSRRNGLKHGMTGQGIVIPDEDVAEVERRKQALQLELAPQSVMGAILVGQLATLSVRMERGAKQEFAAVAERVRHAESDFDKARVDQAEQLFQEIGDDPRKTVRRLLKSPEGIDVMVEAWRDLRSYLTRPTSPTLSRNHTTMAPNLMGLRERDLTGSRFHALSNAVCNDFTGLTDADGGDLDREARRAWARARLVEQIDEEIAILDEHREALDLTIIDQDRAEAGARALFDPSNEANRARRYEAEARRGFFRSLKEFRLVEAEAAEREASAPSAANTSSTTGSDPLASCREGADEDPETADDPSPMSKPASFPPVTCEITPNSSPQRWPSEVGQAVFEVA